MDYDVIIVGGGIIGLSTAYQLLKKNNSLHVAVIEKESTLSFHQTSHNSGVIHAGVYYEPGSLKAKFCHEGNRLTKQFCLEHHIPFKEIGKLIVAKNEFELPRLNMLIERCKSNHIHFEILTDTLTQKSQPGIIASGSIYIPDTGIVNWKQVSQKYAQCFEQLGGKIFLDQRVIDIAEHSSHVVIKTVKRKYKSSYVITCAGLHSDRLVKMSKLRPNFKIIPFRGEYYRLSKQYDPVFRHLIYPVPNPDLPFLGVHFTPQIEGFTTVGPNAVLALAREGYNWFDVNLGDALEILTFFPTWQLIYKYLPATLQELQSSFSKGAYLKRLQDYFPELGREDLIRYPAGIRAQAINEKGEFIHDFWFMETPRILHTCNAPSPAATSSLPIGNYICERFFSTINKTRKQSST